MASVGQGFAAFDFAILPLDLLYSEVMLALLAESAANCYLFEIIARCASGFWFCNDTILIQATIMPINALFLLRVFYELTQVTVMITTSVSLDVL